MDAALRAVSPALREVIVLREFEDLEYAQPTARCSIWAVSDLEGAEVERVVRIWRTQAAKQ